LFCELALYSTLEIIEKNPHSTQFKNQIKLCIKKYYTFESADEVLLPKCHFTSHYLKTLFQRFS